MVTVDVKCQKCGEWAVVLQNGMRTCLQCGHVVPVKWAEEPVAPKAQGDEGARP